MFNTYTRNLILGVIVCLFACIPLAQAVSTDACYDTDTVLMLHMDGADASTAFPDVSIGNETVTAQADAQVDTAFKVFGTGSAKLDGTGDYLIVTDSTAFDFGSNDFTIDMRVRFDKDFASDSKGTHTMLFADTNDSWLAFEYTFEQDRFAFGIWPDTDLFSTSLSKDTDYHVAVTRSSNNIRVFVDGTQVGTTQTNSTSVALGSDFFIGANHNVAASLIFSGWIDELRIIDGIAIWTSNFTPPSAAYTDCNAIVFIPSMEII